MPQPDGHGHAGTECKRDPDSVPVEERHAPQNCCESQQEVLTVRHRSDELLQAARASTSADAGLLLDVEGDDHEPEPQDGD